MSKKMPEERIKFKDKIFDIKNPEAEIPDIYSPYLKKFIKSLLSDSKTRPTARSAYLEIIPKYMTKYLKVTSIISFLSFLFFYLIIYFRPLFSLFLFAQIFHSNLSLLRYAK